MTAHRRRLGIPSDHPCQLVHPVASRQTGDPHLRAPAPLDLLDQQLVLGGSGDRRQMRHAQDLPRRGEPTQLPPQDVRDPAEAVSIALRHTSSSFTSTRAGREPSVGAGAMAPPRQTLELAW